MRMIKMQQRTLLTAEQLGERTHYSARYIIRKLVDYKLFEGTHYIRPFGGKKMLFVWEAIEAEMYGVH